MTLRIGLTGPIGCGKSTVAGWLGETPGVVVIDADRVARDVLAPGTPELAAVAARFGTGLVDDGGVLDRAALGRIVFGDARALQDLEAIVHPGVRRRILAALTAAEADQATAVVIEAIKLVEGGLAAICDEVWLVTCTAATQRDRLAGRGATAADADARIAAQGDLTARLTSVAQRVVDTTGPEAVTRRAVAAAFAAALSRTA